MNLRRGLLALLWVGGGVQGTWFRGHVLHRRFDYPNDRDDEDRYYLVTRVPEDAATAAAAAAVTEFAWIGVEKALAEVASGTSVEGEGQVFWENATVVSDVRTLTLTPPPPATPPATAAAAAVIVVKTLTFVLNICGIRTATHAAVFRAQAKTLRGLFHSCSIGRARMTSRVLHPIEVPCQGNTTWGRVYNASQECREREFVGWAEYAERYAQGVLRVDVGDYPYRLFVIPKYGLPGCGWLGLADVGCLGGGGCRSWIKGGPEGYSVLAAFHEFGHNLGLLHATGPDGSEYGDDTAAMGGCCAVRCHNAPQAWALGWHDPIVVLNDGETPPTWWRPVEVALPTMLSNKKNVVRIRFNGSSSTFVSYRAELNGPAAAAAVYVYVFNGTQTNRSFRSQLVAALMPLASYEDPRSGWRATVRVANATHALVSFCRVGAARAAAGAAAAGAGCASVCGNGVCEAFAGETCLTCPKDCRQGVLPRWGPYCCGAEGRCRFHWRCSNRKVSCDEAL